MAKKLNSKRKRNKVIRYFFFSLIMCYLLIRLVPIVSSSSNDTEVVNYGNIQVTHHLDCYIIRSETLIKSNMEGNIKYLVQQGEKVEKGYKIVEISKDVVDDITRKKLEIINQRIESLSADPMHLFEDDIEKLNQEISDIINEIKQYNYQHNLLRIERLKKDLKNKLEKKRIIAGDKSFAGKNLAALKYEQQQLEHKINSAISSIVSPKSGLISYYVDGYENVLSPRGMEAVELEKLKNIDGKVSDLRVSKVIKNQPLFKVIHSHIWYMITWVDDESLRDYKVGKTVIFKFPGGDIRGRVYKIREEGKNNLLIFQLDEYVEDFIHLRKVSIDVIVVNYEGLKIHRDSIIEKNGKEGVYVLDINRYANFKPVKVIGYNDQYAIVESNVFYERNGNDIKTIETIKLYDEVVRNAAKVKEGQLVL